MSSMPWIKLYTEMLYDPKIGRLQDAIKWRFVSLVLLAGECDQDGALMAGTTPMNLDDIAWKMRVTREQCETEIESLLNCGLIALDDDLYYLPKFSERQGRPQSEKREMWRNRKAKQRESNVSQETGEDVTRESRGSHAPRVDKSRVEKNRIDKSKKEGAEKNRARDYHFENLATICRLNPPGNEWAKMPKSASGQVNRFVKELKDIGATEDQITLFGEWWNQNDWRGRQGQPPKPADVVKNWTLFQNGVKTNGNGANKNPQQLGGMLGAIARRQGSQHE